MDYFDKKFKKKKDILVKNIENEVIFIPIKKDATRDVFEHIYYLDNEVSLYIWELIDGRRPVRDIIEGVVTYFEVSFNRAKKEIVNFLNELQQTGVIVESDYDGR